MKQFQLHEQDLENMGDLDLPGTVGHRQESAQQQQYQQYRPQYHILC
jgi:hypothetical protein